MSINLKDFPQLTDELQTIYEEASSNAIADAVGLQVFDVGETSLLNFEHQVLHGIAGVERVADGADLPRLNSEEGDNITYVQRHYGAIAPITKSMRKFDMFAKMQGLIESLVDDAWNKIDQSLADILLLGWDTSQTDVYGDTIATVGPDAKALFNTGHTNGTTSTTYSNIINDGTNTNAALSRTAIVATIKDGKTYTDPNGLIRPIHYDTVLVPPSLTDAANRIVFSEQISGSANWDPNMHVKGTIKEVKTWERLESTGSAGTDTSAYWFMYDSKKVKETLKVLFSERPSLDAPDEVYSNKDWDYSLDYFYTIGIGFQPYIRGSKGTNA